MYKYIFALVFFLSPFFVSASSYTFPSVSLTCNPSTSLYFIGSFTATSTYIIDTINYNVTSYLSMGDKFAESAIIFVSNIEGVYSSSTGWKIYPAFTDPSYFTFPIGATSTTWEDASHNGYSVTNGVSYKVYLENRASCGDVGYSWDTLNFSFSVPSDPFSYTFGTSSVSAYSWFTGLLDSGGLGSVMNFDLLYPTADNYDPAVGNQFSATYFNPSTGLYYNNATSAQASALIASASASYASLGSSSVVYSMATSGILSLYATDGSVITLATNLYFDANSSSSLVNLYPQAFPFSWLIGGYSILQAFSSATIYAASSSRPIHIPVGVLGTTTIDLESTVESNTVLSSLRYYMGLLVYLVFFFGALLAIQKYFR